MKALIVRVDGEEYRGQWETVEVDRSTESFRVQFADIIYEDTSLFKRGREDQMRNHAEGVLEDLVRQHLARKKAIAEEGV